MTSLNDPAALVPFFEIKLDRQLRQIQAAMNEHDPFLSGRGYTDEDGEVATIQTCGHALRFLRDNARCLAERESEALATSIDKLQIQPDARVADVVERWPWTREGRIHRPDLRLPSLLDDMLTLGRRRDPSLTDESPPDVSEEEVAELARSACPANTMYSYGDETIVSSTYEASSLVREVRTVIGAVIPDPRQSEGMLCFRSTSSDRAFVITKRQVMWLYATAVSKERRTKTRAPLLAGNVVRNLVSVARGGAQLRLIEAIAPEAIELEDEKAPDEQARSQLADAVRNHVSAFITRRNQISTVITRVSRVQLADTQPRDAEKIASELDHAFADYVGELGRRGKQAASQIRREAPIRRGQDVWRLWRQDANGERYLRVLARVVWSEQVRPERERRRRRPPAIVRSSLVDQLTPVMTNKIGMHDDQTVRDDRHNIIGRVALIQEATLETVRRGAEALGSVPGHLLIRGLIHRSNDAWNDNDAEPRRVVFDGGWSGMLHSLGINSKYHSSVKDIANAGQCIVWSTPNATMGGLWTWSHERGTRAAPGKVVFVLGDALAPGHAAELARTSNTDRARRARRLVPELRQPPPTRHAHESVRGALWTLHRVLLVELVDHAVELRTRGMVVIKSDRWRELGAQASVPPKLVTRTLEAWVEGDEDAPPLLQRHGDEWTLAEPHAPEREFIADGGEKRMRGQVKGLHRRR